MKSPSRRREAVPPAQNRDATPVIPGAHKLLPHLCGKLRADLSALAQTIGQRRPRRHNPLWTEDCQDAVDQLKQKLTEAPILANPD